MGDGRNRSIPRATQSRGVVSSGSRFRCSSSGRSRFRTNRPGFLGANQVVLTAASGDFSIGMLTPKYKVNPIDCLVCAHEEQTHPAVAACPHCSAALCLGHFSEQQSHRVGGMRYGCQHTCRPLVRESDSSNVQYRIFSIVHRFAFWTRMSKS